MRRTALFLGGLFLATGASLALSAPAQASDHRCWNDHYGTVTYVHTHHSHSHGYDYDNGYGYGNGWGIGNGSVNQLGLVNVNI